MLLRIYRVLTFVLYPFILLYLHYRKKKGKEDPVRFSERLGKASSPRPEGNLIWFHAVSIGESMSIIPLIKQIRENYPELNILCTTGTRTSSELLKKHLPRKVIHQFAPVDATLCVNKFLAHWKPNVAIFIDSELWPNLTTLTYDTGCTMLQVNARMSRNSFERFKKVPKFTEEMLSYFKLTLVQSDIDKQRFEELGATNVEYIGNLKFDAEPLPSNPEIVAELIDQIGNRSLWMAACTHYNEEETIAQAHSILKENRQDVLTIICPRHPERAQDIKVELHDYKIALHSEREEITAETDIYLVDTVGELGSFYRLSNIVFMGGSLIEHGGQNPLEASRLTSAILAGKNTENFLSTYIELDEAGGLYRVDSAEELANYVDGLLEDIDLLDARIKIANDFAQSKQGVTNQTLTRLSHYLDRV